MKERLLFLSLLFCLAHTARSQDSLPLSHINIPVSISLKTLFAAAERNVDTVFSSPKYPDGWVQSDCATRYKYRFRRSKLQMAMSRNLLQMGFTGYYQIIGSTRACVNGTVLSPWTPACRCGFEEGERRVKVGFTSSFELLPTGILRTRMSRTEPVPLDACTVCFWGQDITKEVMAGLKAELDLSRKAVEDSFGSMNLKPYLQKAWDQLAEVWPVPGIGYFSLRPKQIHMDGINAQNNWLNITIGITASPRITLERPAFSRSAVPQLGTGKQPDGFGINLEADLRYDSLSQIITNMMAGQKIRVTEGLFKKEVELQKASIHPLDDSTLLIYVDFTGSFKGTLKLIGKPQYDRQKNAIVITGLQYDLQTKNLLLKTAKWLFNQKILDQLNSYTYFDLNPYYAKAKTSLNEFLNKEWTKGIRGKGSVSGLGLSSILIRPEHLLIRSNCTGNLSVIVEQLSLEM